MGKHSRNNTANAVFTHAERQQVGDGTKRLRVGKDSLRDFHACCLCLQRARNPVCCNQGHLACKECMYENILAQKKDIQRLQALVESQAKQERVEERSKEQEERDRRAAEFAKDQDSVLASTGASSGSPAKKHVPSFWIPSKAPEEKPDQVKTVNKETLCPLGKDHPVSIKKLITVHFTLDEFATTNHNNNNNNNKQATPICGSCRKGLSNSMKLIVNRLCGHVLCSTCSDKFQLGTGRCFVCEEKCKDKDRIELTHEGSGFASTSKVEIEKYAPAMLV